MKKLLTIAVLLLLPLFATARETEHVLAKDGTLFSIRTQLASETPEVATDATQYLVLDTRRGGEKTSQIIPATMRKGAHGSAAMTYDAESKTLFVFWLHDTSMLSSELLFASLDSSGNWSEATAFGKPFNVRENLRIAVTRKVHDKAKEKLVPGLSVHAVWWEFDSQRIDGLWSAQYALLAIENGQVAEVNFFDLSSLVEGEKSDQAQASLLRHPQLFPAANHDGVVVVYGDVTTNRLHKARISPIKSDGRLRVPVGKREGGFEAPGLDVAANSTVGSIIGDDGIAYYVRDGNQVRYVVFRDNAWTDAQSIALDSHVTGPAAVDAIRRLLNE